MGCCSVSTFRMSLVSHVLDTHNKDLCKVLTGLSGIYDAIKNTLDY